MEQLRYDDSLQSKLTVAYSNNSWPNYPSEISHIRMRAWPGLELQFLHMQTFFFKFCAGEFRGSVKTTASFKQNIERPSNIIFLPTKLSKT